jgi:hypothetical protein
MVSSLTFNDPSFARYRATTISTPVVTEFFVHSRRNSACGAPHSIAQSIRNLPVRSFRVQMQPRVGIAPLHLRERAAQGHRLLPVVFR